MTRGFVRFFDLTLPLSLPRADWVMSIEARKKIKTNAAAARLRPEGDEI